MTYGYAVTNRLVTDAAGIYTVAPALVATSAYARDRRAARLVSMGSVANAAGIVVDFGAARELVGFALINHNIVGEGGGTPTITVLADTGSGFGTAVTAKAASTLNTAAPMQKDHLFLFPAVTKRWWKLQVAGMSTSPITLQFGELFGITAVTSLSRGSIYGSGEEEDILQSTVRFPSGERRGIFLGGPVREKRLKWADFTDAQRLELRTMWAATRGSVTPVLWMESVNSTSSAATAAEQECLYGFLEVDKFGAPQDDYAVFQPPDFIVRALGREVGS